MTSNSLHFGWPLKVIFQTCLRTASLSLMACLVLASVACSGGSNKSKSATNQTEQSEETADSDKSKNDEVTKKAPKKKPRLENDSLATVKKLESIGATCETNDFGNVRSIIFPSKEEFTLLAFKDLAEVEHVSFSGCELPEGFLQDLTFILPICASLRSLDLSQTNVTDTMLQSIEKLGKLESLNLANTNISNAALPTLAKLTKLKELDLSWSKVSGELKPLKALGELESLGLAWTDIGEQELVAILSELKKLSSVDVEGSALLDGNAEAFAKQHKSIRFIGMATVVAEAPTEPVAGDGKKETFEVFEAHAIEGESLTGKPLKLSDCRGKVVLLDFWGHWCPHCRDFYDEAKSLHKQWSDKGLVLVGVNSDESKEAALEIMTKQEMKWSSWWDGGLGGKIAKQWSVNAWPTLFLIDKKGNVRHKDLRGGELESAIKELLAE